MTAKRKQRRYKILTVDDSRAILTKITSFLEKRPEYEVTGVSDPVEAYALVENEHFDVVICDIEMPQMSGLELLRKIKNFNGAIQVIVITGYITVNNTLDAFRYGAADLFFKPIKLKALGKAVEMSIDRLNHIEDLLHEVVSMREGRMINA